MGEGEGGEGQQEECQRLSMVKSARGASSVIIDDKI